MIDLTHYEKLNIGEHDINYLEGIYRLKNIITQLKDIKITKNSD